MCDGWKQQAGAHLNPFPPLPPLPRIRTLSHTGTCQELVAQGLLRGCIRVSMCLSISVYVSVSVSVSMCLSKSVFVPVSVYVPISVYVSMSVYVPVSVSVSVHGFARWCVSPARQHGYLSDCKLAAHKQTHTTQ